MWEVPGISRGIRLASSVSVRLDFPRVVLILLSLSTCAVRVQARTTAMPDVTTEVNSCLRMVRVVASRRGRGVAQTDVPVRVRRARSSRRA
jgi:hypothetical protein